MQYNLYWFGRLTTENVEQVGKLLSELLEGKFYTVITAIPRRCPGDAQASDIRMDVRTSQKLVAEGACDKKAIVAHRGDKKAIVAEVSDDRAHLTIHDTFGLYCIDSDLQREVGHDPTYQNPYIVFEGNRVTIRHRSPAGNLLVWVFAVEDHTEY
jgi:hypothetical protein